MTATSAAPPPPDLAVLPGRDPEALPERCVIHLMPGQLDQALLESVPENLRSKFSFYGSVTPAEYLRLTGADDYSDLKWRLAVETADSDNFTVKVTPEDVLTQETGAKALQSRLIRYWMQKAGQKAPASDAEYMDLAKPLEEMPYAAIEFLLGLADLYGLEPYDDDSMFAEALSQEQPPMLWDEFAYPYPEI